MRSFDDVILDFPREKVSRDRIMDVSGRSSAVHVRGVRGKEKREDMACGFLRPNDPVARKSISPRYRKNLVRCEPTAPHVAVC